MMMLGDAAARTAAVRAAARRGQREIVLWRVKVFPAGPVRVAERVQEPFAQLPVTLTLEVPRGPVAEPERVQALASATAATDSAPMKAVVRKSFFMGLSP
jgi:hypothetical protein